MSARHGRKGALLVVGLVVVLMVGFPIAGLGGVSGWSAVASEGSPCGAGDVRVYMTASGPYWWDEDDDVAVIAALETIDGGATGLCISRGVAFHQLAGVTGGISTSDFDVIMFQSNANWLSHPHFGADDAAVITGFLAAGGGLVVSEWTTFNVRWGQGDGWPVLQPVLPASYSADRTGNVRMYRWDRSANAVLDAGVSEDFVLATRMGLLNPKVGAAVPYLATLDSGGSEPPPAQAFDREPGEEATFSSVVWTALSAWEVEVGEGAGPARVAAFATLNMAPQLSDPGASDYSADLRQLVANTLRWASGLGDPLPALSVGPEAPGTPVAPTVEAEVSSVVVSVAQPSTGGEPTSFTVTASPGGATCTVSGSSGSCAVTGLDPATTYTFAATASNDGGTSGASSASLPISPLAPPPPAPTPTYAQADVQDRFPTVVGGGTPAVGVTFLAPEVTWSNSPTSFSWRWQACTDWMSVPGSCVEETTATETLVVPASFAGRQVRVLASATNAGGTGIASAMWRTGTVAAEPVSMNVATLGTELCAGGGSTVTLAARVDDADETLTIAAGCSATLDMNGWDVVARNVVLGADSTLTVRDTSPNENGFLRAEGAVFGVAGIRTAGATLRIESGVVVANGGATAAGIGGDGLADRDGGTVEITGGTVEARGGMDGAGIGGGFTGAGGTVTISGGTVDVFAGSSAAAIGGGSSGAGGTITITGGAVIAEGTGLDPIGPGSGGAPGTVTIGAGGSRCDDGLFAIIAFDGSGASCATEDPGTGLDPGTDEDDGSGQVEHARVDGSPAPASVRNGPLGCAPAVVRLGASVECTITGGTPGSQLAWRAAFNPVFAGDTVTLDSAGAGSFRFTIPAAAAGRPIMVELVDLEATVVVASEGGPVPSSVPAGEGPPAVLPRLVSLTSLALALALLLATWVLAPGGRGARVRKVALRA